MQNKIQFTKWITLILLFILVVLNVPSFGQTLKAKGINYIPEIEVMFNEGIMYYRKGDFPKAQEFFSLLIKEYPPHQRITISYIMSAKCAYKLGNYQQAISLTDKLIQNYPQSHYISYASFVKGYSLYQLGKFSNSLTCFLAVADQSEDKKLVEKAQNFALEIIDNNITLSELIKLKEKVTPGKISAAIITIKMAVKYLNIGKRDQAISLLQNFIKLYPDNPYKSYIQKLLSRKNIPVKSNQIKIGIILPISGEYAEQARGVLAGIRYAQKKYNDTSNVQIDLVVKDSEGDIVKVVKSTRELLHDNEVIAIIGELERDKTVAIVAALNSSNIPLIAPTTSGNGVTSLNNYTFQANTDVETRGARLAEYAIQELGLKTFATLSPTDAYGRQMTDSFTSTVDTLGGTVLVQKWYYPGTEDFGRQLKSIRELGFNMMNKDSLIHYYTWNLTNLQKRRFDEEDIPVTSIDGVFFPCYTDEIQYIAPQFALVNIRAQVLGGEYWYDIHELRKVQQYVDGIIFCSSYFIDETDPDFVKFRNDFRVVMKRTPEVMELYGYDAMSIIVDAVSNHNLTREDIADYLKNLTNFKGIKGTISFNKNNRVNSDIRLLTFKNGRIESIK